MDKHDYEIPHDYVNVRARVNQLDNKGAPPPVPQKPKHLKQPEQGKSVGYVLPQVRNEVVRPKSEKVADGGYEELGDIPASPQVLSSPYEPLDVYDDVARPAKPKRNFCKSKR